MAGLIRVPGYMPAFTSGGNLISGCLLYVFLNNTNSLATVYANAGLTTPLPNPVQADALGVFPFVYAPTGSLYNVSVTDALGRPLPGGALDNLNVSQDASDAVVAQCMAYAASAAASALAAQAVSKIFPPFSTEPDPALYPTYFNTTTLAFRAYRDGQWFTIATY